VPYPVASLVAIGTAVPDHDIHAAFVDWAAARLDARESSIFGRMAKRSGIDHRYAVLPRTKDGGSPVCDGGFYAVAPLPSTAARMALYEQYAPDLAMASIADLGTAFDPSRVTHIIVASCTGFTAPGIDQILAARLRLSPSVERLLVGFMGCYAAVTALRSARHIIRSTPDACVLVVTVELSSLHLQPVNEIEPLLAMLQFGDGAAAAIVTADQPGLALGDTFALTLPDSESLIRWAIGDMGFAMHLSGEVPHRIAIALADPAVQCTTMGGVAAHEISSWAVHAGGRTILDAVEQGLGLDPQALDASRAVLRDQGNMSSSTLMFALREAMADRPGSGIALAFGPGLACEGFRYGWHD
jgi:predicted naringenin-chalcone synthase